MVKVSVITPVWNKSDLTNKFLFQNWQLYRERPGVEFVIIDNGSTDNTAQILQGWQAMMATTGHLVAGQLHVITNEDNRGFGPANNQGVTVARGEVLVFISNDAIIEGPYLPESLEGHARDMLIGPQVFRHDTGWNKFGDTIIPYVAGWCVICHRDTWQELGGWDERFVPCDYEDVDLSLAATKKGIALQQTPLPLSHLSGQSAQHLEGGRLAITLKNQALFKEKWGFA